MQKLALLYKEWAGIKPQRIEEIQSGGSNRQYFRLFAPTGVEPRSVIGVYDSSAEETQTFIYLTTEFGRRNLPVPKILKVSEDYECYLQSDLGQTSLYQALADGRNAGGRYNLKEKELLRRTIIKLPEIQLRGGHGLDFNRCYPQPDFDRNSVLFDLNYFKYCF